MLQRIRVAAVALATAAGLLALAPSASAAAKAPSISDVDLSPGSPVVVFDNPVTVTFAFTTKDAGKAELQLKPPGLSVGTPIDLKSAPFGQWTKWTGTKSFEAKDAGKWSFLAIAHGDGDKSASGTFGVQKALVTKIVDFGASPGQVHRGDMIKVSGRLLADGKGYAGVVAITFRERSADAYRRVTTVTTGRDGWFSTRVRADATGWWRAEFGGNKEARASVSDSDRVDVRIRHDRDSRIVGFDVTPAPADKGAQLNFTGSLQVERWQALPGQRVSIYFRQDGSRRWEYVTSDVTNRDGRFWATATAQSSGWWRAAFAGTRGVKGSVSDAAWVKVVEPTPPPTVDKSASRVIKFNAYPEPVKRGRYLKARGVLQIDDSGSWEGYAGKVALYFKPVGSHKWQYVKTTRSGDSGKLYVRVKAWKSGSWKFVFGGDDDFYGDSSRSDYVRVKR
ncbi:hypothetical protein [Nonomuraea aurantiaca]|uniref:hypothetical protein n=1 Tax=Nonomuraea aurantiaca TaxID=2878562 RepID=UPI001CD91F51|nr:hypothetical protein [Nonomuraea aurantiaca]MCA2220528.1 hypothetical protein [Nonomuraea aurantiaca]